MDKEEHKLEYMDVYREFQGQFETKIEGQGETLIANLLTSTPSLFSPSRQLRQPSPPESSSSPQPSGFLKDNGYSSEDLVDAVKEEQKTHGDAAGPRHLPRP